MIAATCQGGNRARHRTGQEQHDFRRHAAAMEAGEHRFERHIGGRARARHRDFGGRIFVGVVLGRRVTGPRRADYPARLGSSALLARWHSRTVRGGHGSPQNQSGGCIA